MTMHVPHPTAEWLEADGLGGFASGTVSGERTRRYHALLLRALTPPTGRVVLVNGMDVSLETGSGRHWLSTQRYTPDAVAPDGWRRITSFSTEPWPTWEYLLDDGVQIRQEFCMCHGKGIIVIRWSLLSDHASARLSVRLFLSGRDYHALHHENGAFRFDPLVRGRRVTWRPYAQLPAIHALASGNYRHEPVWYRSFLYTEERVRGLDCTEDLAAPGVFDFDLTQQEAVLVLAANGSTDLEGTGDESPVRFAAALLHRERVRRRAFASPLHRAADAYLVKRGNGTTIVAGYPWFTDWGRDTFIALRGLCLATGNVGTAGAILAEWSGAVSGGMLPNFFPDGHQAPEYNTVDAALWYVIAAHEYLEATRALSTCASSRDALERAILAIVEGYAEGTRHGIRMDKDGLLASGGTGVQLTWMDAKIGDWVVTPRTGKQVEIQALWINALRIAGTLDSKWNEIAVKAKESFQDRFWDSVRGYLCDVVDVDHQPGTVDAALRPNQVLAIGGLPHALIDGDHARRVLDTLEARLVTPLGMRSLAPGEPGYAGRYEGGPAQRDAVYHQGTVWPWLMGPFVDAWLRVRGDTAVNRAAARRRFVDPLLEHLNEAGLGHVSEIADAEPPHVPRGCPFQAWSVGELLRVLARVEAAP